MKRSCGLVFKKVIKVFYHWWQDPMPSLLVFKNGIHYLTILTGKKYVTKLQKPQMTHDFVGFRCDFCIEFYQQADICFCERSLISPLCSFCKQEEEAITHLFCAVIQSFWSYLQTLIKEIGINCMHFELSEALVLFGVTDNIIKVIGLFIFLLSSTFTDVNGERMRLI